MPKKSNLPSNLYTMESPLNRKERKKLNDTLADVLKRFENIQRQVNNLVVEGDSSPEAAQARIDADGKIYRTLKERLDTEQNNKADASDLLQTNELLHKKASIEYVDQIVQGLTGGPAGVYDTLALLQNAFPKGNDKVYVVKEDGKWYYYDGAWLAGGDYQNTAQVTELQKVVDTSRVNMLDNGDFSDGLTGWETPNNAITPTVDVNDYRSYPQSIQVNSTGTSSHVRRSVNFTIDHKYYIGAYVKCTRYVTGTIGIQLGGTPNITIGKNAVTNGYERVSRLHDANLATRNVYVGAINSADLDGHVDDVMIVDLTAILGAGNEPTLNDFETMIDKTFANKALPKTINGLETLSLVKEVDERSKIYLENLIVNGGFSNDLTGWTIGAGTPSVDIAIHKTAPNSLNSNSNGTSSQVRQAVTVITGHKYYISAQVSCTRYVAGVLGFQLARNNAGFLTRGARAITNGFVKVSDTFDSTTNTITVYVGGISSADLDGHVDDLVLIDLTAIFGQGKEPTLEVFESLLSIKDIEWFENEQEIELKTIDLLHVSVSDNNEYVPVSEDVAKEAFISKMNEKAVSLGMENSNFVNPHGLGDAQQLTTASDLIKLGINACGYDELLKVWNKKTYTVKVTGVNARDVVLTTSVTGATLEDHYYIFGGKTGTLSGNLATQNIISIVNAPDERWFVGVILGATNNDRFAASKQLYDIANKAVQGQNVDAEDVSANFAAVAFVPKMNPFGYENYNVNLLYGKNKDGQTSPASVTKVLNAITALDYIQDMNETVEIIASDITSGSGNVFKTGDIVTYKDLLYAMMLPSSNTAATVMARLIGTKILSY